MEVNRVCMEVICMEVIGVWRFSVYGGDLHVYDGDSYGGEWCMEVVCVCGGDPC